jgi:proteasome lid subunit RPN8/RPN11
MKILDLLELEPQDQDWNWERQEGHLFLLPRELLEKTRQALWAKGKSGTEEAVLWAGWRIRSNRSVISTLIRPRTRSSAAEVIIPPEEVLAVATAVSQRGKAFSIMMHVHTHGCEWIDLSEIDRRTPFTFREGFIHIVIPHFGRFGFQAVGIHETIGVYRGRIRTRRLLPEEVRRRFLLLDSEDLQAVIRHAP